MDTYYNFNDKFVRLGKASESGIECPVCSSIIRSISNAEGGASISFKPLDDDNFKNLTSCFENPVKYGDESYIVEISESITIYYTAEITKQYALYAIKRHYSREGVKQGVIYNTPKVPFRCLRTYLPGKKNIEWFKTLVDMQIALGNNAIMLEIGGAMEYKRHPEINEGWVEYCKLFDTFEKNTFARRIMDYPKNSIHDDNGEGGWLTYEEVADIVEFCKERHFEIIPEVPSLSHADYILYKHPEMSETEGDPIPNFACPLNEDYQALVKDILDEVVEVFKPRRVNISHDEVYALGVCPKCKGKDTTKLFNEDVLRLYNHLKAKGVGTMLWCDCAMLTSRSEPSYHVRNEWDGKSTVELLGKTYKVRSFRWSSPEGWEAIKAENPDAKAWFSPKKNNVDMLPKDIEVLNWYWGLAPDVEAFCIENGFTTYFGNFFALSLKDFEERISKGVKGVMASNWGPTDYEGARRTNCIFSIAYNAYASWCECYDENKFEDAIFEVAETLYKNMNYSVLANKHLEITHSTDALIEHDSYMDNAKVFIDDFYMGDYEVKYKDGTVQNVPVYWGLNIGNNSIGWDGSTDGYKLSLKNVNYASSYIFEPIGTSMPIREGDKTSYNFVIPVNGEVEDVTLKTVDGYSINFEGWKVV